METKKLAQAYLNGKPIWKCSHSELTAYCKKNGIELQAGIKTYQVGSIVKKHLEKNGEGSKEGSQAKAGSVSHSKEKATTAVKKPGKEDLVKQIEAKAGKLGNKNAKSAGFEIGEKVTFTERGTQKEKKGEILKIIFVRKKFHAHVKTHDKDQWVGVSKLAKA
jgi:hypothetical protein